MLLVVTLTVEREQLEAFRAYETAAYRIIAKHGGVLERALVLDEDPTTPRLRELHIVRFPDEASFTRYREDPETVARKPTRDACILATDIARASDGPTY